MGAQGFQGLARQALGGQHPVVRLALERRIAQLPVRGVVAHKRAGLDAGVMVVTAPAIGLGGGHLPLAQRVTLDIEHRRQHPPGGIEHRGTEAPFPQRAGAAGHPVEVARIAPPHRLHGQAQRVCLLGCGHQVHVVRPQHVGVDGKVMLARGHAQAVEVVQVVVRPQEYGLAVVAALQHQGGKTGGGKAGKACHDRSCEH